METAGSQVLDTARELKPRCWMTGLREVCFVHLGKYGDLMIMLPAFRAVALETGRAPIVIVSTDYADLFDGVSYVRPWPLGVHWWKGVKTAREAAVKRGLDPIVVKWWDEPGAQAPRKLENGKTITLKIHGQLRTVPAAEWDSFQASQWRYAGFTMEQMMTWPLVFDRRDAEREQALRAKCFRSGKRPVLVNLPYTGTSPFRSAMAVTALLRGRGFELVNLAGIKAHRIYDLLGLYDHAAGLVTSDTATLHLAAASKIPYIAFVNNGGAGSVPRGNCILSVRYNEFPHRQSDVVAALKKFEV